MRTGDPNYPRMMFHPSKPPVTIGSREEEIALGGEWSRTIPPPAAPPEPAADPASEAWKEFQEWKRRRSAQGAAPEPEPEPEPEGIIAADDCAEWEAAPDPEPKPEAKPEHHQKPHVTHEKPAAKKRKR